MTGNTGIDAVLYVRDQLERGSRSRRRFGPARLRQAADSGHQPSPREFRAAAFERTCTPWLASRLGVGRPMVYPGPSQSQCGRRRSRNAGRHSQYSCCSIRLPYVPFVDLMRRSRLIITDSGGIQEEAPSLGKPVLVLREKTERPRSGRSGHRQTGGNRRGANRRRSHATARRRGVCPHDPRPQSVWRWPC